MRSAEMHQLVTLRNSAPDLRMVIMVGPGPGRQGGISRMVEYVTTAWPLDGPELVIVDPAPSGGPAPVSLARALARVATLALRHRPGVVVHLHMASRGSAARKVLFAWLSHLLGVPYVLHLHSGHFETFLSNLPRPARALIQRVFRSAATVLVLGRVWETFVLDTLGVKRDLVVLLPNAVPDPGPTQSEDRRPPRLVYLGRLSDDKGTPELLQALSDPLLRNKQWEAVFAGDGDLERFRAMAQQLGIAERVRFFDWLRPTEVGRMLASAALLTLPSHAEGSPMVILEALSHGVPVVATDVGGIPDLIRHGKEGILVSSGDSEALARALTDLLGQPLLRNSLAGNARRRWAERFDINTYVTELHKVHLMSLGKPQSKRRHSVDVRES